MPNDANVAHAHAFMWPHVNNLADVALSAHGILGCAFFAVRFRQIEKNFGVRCIALPYSASTLT